jgi:nicotinamide-nucleotide amidase
MLAVAESFTGGRVAAALTGVAGSSQSFAGGVVAYADAAKISLLGVSAATLQRSGAVSEEVAREMARGVRERFGATIALSTTGIAGPSGATPEKPVGLGWLALDDAGSGVAVRRVSLSGEREAIASRATTIALGMLWQHLAHQSS